MATKMYIARCQWCGKTGGSAGGTSTGGAPTSQPHVSGNCPSNPSGNTSHAPRWDLKWQYLTTKNSLRTLNIIRFKAVFIFFHLKWKLQLLKVYSQQLLKNWKSVHLLSTDIISTYLILSRYEYTLNIN